MVMIVFIPLVMAMLCIGIVERADAYSLDRSPSFSPSTSLSSSSTLMRSDTRRAFFSASIAAAVFGASSSSSSLLGPSIAAAAAAAEEEEEEEDGASASASGSGGKLVDVYFGVGCFWHIQHEFALAEKSILGRSNKELTSKAGYAGGTRTDREGRVCYHNLAGVADYGKLGHGEVVGMTIPEDKIGDFAVEYFGYFSPQGERVDPMDRGAEYRSLIGLPGGTSHPQYPKVSAAAKAMGMTLVPGNGNDPDTFGRKVVYVYDTAKFPFYQAEIYHQYHNDFQSLPYGKAYNNLANVALEDGRLKITGCPDRV